MDRSSVLSFGALTVLYSLRGHGRDNAFCVCAFVQLLSQEEDPRDGGPEVRELRDELQSVAVDASHRR